MGDLSSSSGGHRALKKRTMGGTFDVAGATQALELLEEEKLYGSLTVSDGLIDLCCFFTRGGLRVISSGRNLPSLRARLVADGLLGEKDARKVAQVINSTRGKDVKDEREILIRELHWKPNDVDEVVAELLEESLLDCLFWDDPQFEVSTGEPNMEIMQRTDLSALTLSIGVGKLITSIKNRLRSVSEIRRTVASLDVVAEPTAKGRSAVDEGLPLGDGRPGRQRLRFIRTVVKEPGLDARTLGHRVKIGELEVATRLHELSTRGYLNVTRKPRSKKEEMARIREMEEAIDQALNQLLRRNRLAKNSAAVGDEARAARHLARAGGLLMQDGRADEAVRTFSQALRHSEDDLEAREGFVQGLWATGKKEQAARESEQLGQRYLSLNLPGRARRVLERALGYEEQTSTLSLFVESLVRLKRTKATADAGQRLVNRLRREGREGDAQEVAGRLMALGDDEDRRRLARAAGVNRKALAALVVIGALLGAGFYPLQMRAQAQGDYKLAVRSVQDELAQAQSWDKVGPAVQRSLDLLRPLSAGESKIALRARDATRRLENIQADLQRADRLVGGLPWQESADAEFLLSDVEQLATKVESEALSAPLITLKQELQTYQKEFQRRRALLSSMGLGDESFAAARQLREEFSKLPSGLEMAFVPIKVTSEPSGATVTVDGVEFNRQTPDATLNMPLRGSVRVEVWLADHETRERELSFDELEGPVVHFELEPKGGRPRPTRTPKPRPTRSPTPTRSPSPKPTRKPRPRPSPTRSKPAYVAQVELREGYLKGSPPRGMSVTYEEERDFFKEIRLNNRYRVYIQPVNLIEGQKVYMTGWRITIYVRRRAGWKPERPRVFELDERYLRLVTLHPGRKLHVGRFSRTVHLDLEYAREVAEEGIERMLIELQRGERR